MSLTDFVNRRDVVHDQIIVAQEPDDFPVLVGQAIGLEMGTASSDYIQMYAGNAALLAESLEVIQRTSAVILGAILPEGATEERTSVPDVA